MVPEPQLLDLDVKQASSLPLQAESVGTFWHFLCPAGGTDSMHGSLWYFNGVLNEPLINNKPPNNADCPWLRWIAREKMRKKKYHTPKAKQRNNLRVSNGRIKTIIFVCFLVNAKGIVAIKASHLSGWTHPRVHHKCTTMVIDERIIPAIYVW